MLRASLIKILQLFASAILRKYNPRIVAITGSVGKTSAKEAIFAILKNNFTVWRSRGNYNNEIGVPLAIIGTETAGHSFFRWLSVFIRAFWLIVWPCRYPSILILEMGADHMGDITRLVKLAPPTISVVTAVAPVHLESFGSLKRIAVEKGKLIEFLGKDGAAVLNYDDELVLVMKEKTKAPVITFGFDEGADVRAVEMSECLEGAIPSTGTVTMLGGINFKIQYQGNIVPVFLPNVLGKQHIYAALAAATVGLCFGLNLVTIAEGLKKYEAERGRVRLISGIKDTIIIDDTYNSSPRAALEALDVLNRLAPQGERRRIIVLGDMLELGSYTEEGHRLIGRKSVKSGELLITIGERAHFIADEAIKAGLPKERVMMMHTTNEAGHFLQNEIKQGDVVLIKGSQGMRMEKIVKEIMAEPLRAGELLARQSREWKGKM